MDGSVLYTHAGPFPTPSSLPPLSLESNPCFSIINPSWIQDTAGRPFKSSGTSTESRVLVRVTDGLYARPLPMRHGIILKPLLFDRGGGNRWWTREASRTRAAFYSRACLPACLHTFFLLFLFFFFFLYVQYRRILELFRGVLSPRRVSRTCGHLAPSGTSVPLHFFLWNFFPPLGSFLSVERRMFMSVMDPSLKFFFRDCAFVRAMYSIIVRGREGKRLCERFWRGVVYDFFHSWLDFIYYHWFKDEDAWNFIIGLFMEVVKRFFSFFKISNNTRSSMINTRNVIKIFSPIPRNILFLFWIFHHFQLNFLENIFLPSIVTTDFLFFLAALRPSVNTYLINHPFFYPSCFIVYFLAHLTMNFLQFMQTFDSLFNDY